MFLTITLPLLATISQLKIFAESNYNGPSIANILTALLLILLSVITVGSIATTVSSKFNSFHTTIITGVIFFLGLANSYLQINISQVNQTFGMIFKTIIPNWQYFWIVDALDSKINIPIIYVQYACAYTVTYMLMSILWSIYIFREREINI